MKNNLPSKYFLAPMAELSTPPLRCIIKKLSPSTALYSEMLAAGPIAANAIHNEPLIKKWEFDDPLIYQLVGSDPSVMAEAVKQLSGRNPYGYDINMGCGAPDIIKKGSGAKLITDPDLACRIVAACVKTAPGQISVKIRTGWSENNFEYILKLINRLADEGISHITIHPRFGKQAFRGKADWELLKNLKNELKIPVIGNGDLTDPAKINYYLKNNYCDAIMLARGAVTTPWLFSLMEITQSDLSDNNLTKTIDRLSVPLELIELTRSMLPENLHLSRIWRFSLYYCQGLLYGHRLFSDIRNTSDLDLIAELYKNYFELNESERWLNYFFNGEFYENSALQSQ